MIVKGEVFLVKEIFFIRAFACICIVFMHSVTRVIEDFSVKDNPTSELYYALHTIQALLMFGTPIFIFISEYLLSLSYRKGTPDGFYRKRAQFILIPYLVVAFLYVGVRSISTGVGSAEEFLLTLIRVVVFGDFHGYFIIIIFQFYLLHFLFNRFIVYRFKATNVLVVSLIANVLYLSVFNFLNPDTVLGNMNSPKEFIWDRLGTLPFVGWIFYFSLAYYSGRSPEKFKDFLANSKYSIIFLLVSSSALLLSLTFTGTIDSISSKRVDVVFYTTAITLLLFYLASKFKTVPSGIVSISQTSFGIYLYHPLFQLVAQVIIGIFLDGGSLLLNVSIYFTVGLLTPLLLTYLFNRNKFGYLIFGKLGKAYKSESKLTKKMKVESTA